MTYNVSVVGVFCAKLQVTGPDAVVGRWMRCSLRCNKHHGLFPICSLSSFRPRLSRTHTLTRTLNNGESCQPVLYLGIFCFSQVRRELLASSSSSSPSPSSPPPSTFTLFWFSSHSLTSLDI